MANSPAFRPAAPAAFAAGPPGAGPAPARDPARPRPAAPGWLPARGDLPGLRLRWSYGISMVFDSVSLSPKPFFAIFLIFIYVDINGFDTKINGWIMVDMSAFFFDGSPCFLPLFCLGLIYDDLCFLLYLSVFRQFWSILWPWYIYEWLKSHY